MMAPRVLVHFFSIGFDEGACSMRSTMFLFREKDLSPEDIEYFYSLSRKGSMCDDCEDRFMDIQERAMESNWQHDETETIVDVENVSRYIQIRMAF